MVYMEGCFCQVAVIAFAPIDHENTLMYIRYYHNLRLPLLCQLYSWLGSLGSLVIERQDRRVVMHRDHIAPTWELAKY